MGLPGRRSRWRRPPGPAERPRPATRPDAFVPGRVLVGFETGAGEQGRRTGAAAGRVVAGRAGPGWSSSTGVPTSGRPPPAGQPAGRGLRRAGLAPPGRRLRPRGLLAPPAPPGRQRGRRPRRQPPGGRPHRGRGRHRGPGFDPDDPATTGVDETDDLDLEDRVAGRWRCRDDGCVEAVATPTSSHGTEVASVLAAADVFGQLNQVRACGGDEDVGCSTAGLHFEADARGAYLLDVFSTRPAGGYRLTRTVRPHLERSWPRPQPVRAPYRRRRPGHTTTFAMTSSERGRLRVGHLPLRQHQSGPAPSERDPGRRAPAGHLVREDVGGTRLRGPSPTSSRPPTPPATPRHPSVIGSGCCSDRAFRGGGPSFR